MPVYAENAKLNFSYDRQFLAISASLERKRAKKSVDNHINFHLYHYAGNNPVKYVDPDGNETCPSFFSGFEKPSSEFWGMLSSFASGIDRITTTAISAQSGNEISKIELNRISPYMSEAMTEATGQMAIGGMEFMADNGSSLALVAYASGQIEVGMIIDGITVACDCTLEFSKAQKTGDYSKFATTTVRNIASVAVGIGVSSKIASSSVKAFNNLPDTTTKKAIESMSNVLGEYASSVTSKAMKCYTGDDE